LYRQAKARADDRPRGHYGPGQRCPTRHPRAISTVRPSAHPDGTTLSISRDHLALAAGNGTDHTIPIASAARGSVQSGFNDVALATLAIVGVARPHRSLQIPTPTVAV
jgi:hypothetical protein